VAVPLWANWITKIPLKLVRLVTKRIDVKCKVVCEGGPI
jgi:hypothetical protein